MKKVDYCKVKDILDKAKSLKGLCKEEVTYLLSHHYDREVTNLVFELAKDIKDTIYGKRIVFFAPLYISNICQNECAYCGFQKSNKEITRKKLTKNELKKEIEYLIDQGVKRILLVASEDPQLSVEEICDHIELCYETKTEKGEIRRVNVNIAPLKKEEFKLLKNAKIGTYQVFQETYNEEKYRLYHTAGPKSDFKFRYEAPFRAIEAGIDDIGMGILFGLDNPVSEIRGLFEHIAEMERRYGIGPHTISVPRIKRAVGAKLSYEPPYFIDDEYFAFIVAILRIAIPYTGIILSTRESKVLRDRLIDIGVSQISAGSSTSPGGYSTDKKKFSEQFTISDNRSLKEMVITLAEKGYLPSFCTACYRRGRTGEVFMELAKTGSIKNLCDKNSLLSFAEYVANFDEDNREPLKAYIEDLVKYFDEDLKNKVNLIFFGHKDIYY